MDFSWLGITVIDIGIVSVGIIGFARLFRRIAILERENGKLQAAVNVLTKENETLRQEFEKEYQNLKAEFEQKKRSTSTGPQCHGSAIYRNQRDAYTPSQA